MKGLIALDIDGTLTSQLDAIPKPVTTYLHQLVEKGWEIALVTGRMYSFANILLYSLDFPYLLILQNGADILQMPEKKLLSQRYLSAKTVHKIAALYGEAPKDFLLYTGYSRGDFCCFCKRATSQAFCLYLEKLKDLTPVVCHPLEELAFEEEETFSLVKCVGTEKEMKWVATQLQHIEGISVSLIRDPVDPALFLNLITHQDANKGVAVQWVKKQLQPPFIIAAGDDRNDVSMLEQADFAIAMAQAPKEVLKVANLIAKPAVELGILDALKEAISSAPA